MLEAVHEAVPKLYPFVHSAYEQPSSLFYGDLSLLSAEGIQQGDPLGPLLFCLTIHHLRSEFKVFYLDDGTLGGKTSDVLADFQLVEALGAPVGLHLNHTKCELISENPSASDTILEVLPGLQVVSLDNEELLGSLIGNSESVCQAIRRKCEKLKLLKSRLCLLYALDALLLLRHALAIPKLLYILRTAPCFQSHLVHIFDSILQSSVCEITNVCLDDDRVWFQVSLPVANGGIGIRRAAELAPSAFLVSAAGCSSLIKQILPASLHKTNNVWTNSALLKWQQDHKEPPPTEENSHLQRAWEKPKINATFKHLLNDTQDPSTRARLLAVTTKESGAWLNTPPLSTVGLRMDKDTIRIAVGLHLGAKICKPHSCFQCGSPVDDKGTHALSCRISKGRSSRHNTINNIIKRSLDVAGFPSHLEPPGLSRSDGKRPDGMSIVPWKHGKSLVWDATCLDTLAPSYIALSTMMLDDASILCKLDCRSLRLSPIVASLLLLLCNANSLLAILPNLIYILYIY